MIWFVTAFFGATGFALLLCTLIPSDTNLTQGDRKLLKRTISITSVLALLVLVIWASGHASIPLSEGGHWVFNIWLLCALFVACFAITFVVFTKQNTKRIGLILLSACTLATCWAARWVTMMSVQTIPKFDVGPYPYDLPLGSSGLLGIVGMFGLWIALALLGSELVQDKQLTSEQ